MQRIANPSTPVRFRPQPPLLFMKILFLGYSANETSLINFLRLHNFEVIEFSGKMTSFQEYDLVISFGYRHIITKDLLDSSPRPVINLHIGFLPFNRGAHPNFWSFYENTPKGVTIHHIDEGIDTGDVCFQKEVKFSSDENTFKKTQNKLIQEIEKLFRDNFEIIISGRYKTIKQGKVGTFHKKSDLPALINWDDNIQDCLESLGK